MKNLLRAANPKPANETMKLRNLASNSMPLAVLSLLTLTSLYAPSPAAAPVPEISADKIARLHHSSPPVDKLTRARIKGADSLHALKLLANEDSDDFQQLASILKLAGYTSTQTARALRARYKLSAKEMVSLLYEGSYSIDQACRVLRSVYGSSAKQALELLFASSYANEISLLAVKNLYQQNSHAMTSLVKQIETADQDYLINNLLAASTRNFAITLKEAGLTADTVAKALITERHQNAESTAKMLRYAGFDHYSIYLTLSQRLNLSSQALIVTLHQAGYRADQFLKYIADDFELDHDQLMQQFVQAGYPSFIVQRTFEQYFSETENKLIAKLEQP